MRTIKRTKQIAFSLGIIGFIPALFLWAQTLGLGMRTDESKSRASSIIVGGNNVFEDAALSYCVISVCLLLLIGSLLMRDKIFLKVMGVIPLIFIILECRFLIILKNRVLEGKWAYANWLEITYYMDFGFLILTIILMILQFYLILGIYRSSIYNNP